MLELEAQNHNKKEIKFKAN